MSPADATPAVAPDRPFRLVAEAPIPVPGPLNPVLATVAGPDGPFERFFVRSPGAVAVVPVLFDVEGTAVTVLVRQYRVALDGWFDEVPAGMRDVDGEAPERTAQRELAEEAGYVAERLELLTVFHNSAGMTDGTTHVYLATDLRPVERQAHSIEEESMEVHHVPFLEALARVRSGALTDAKTVIGLLLAAGKLGITP